ncbi:hypothetical protein BCR44DRAFT_1173706 [Catenaria anguillulae PL171]|uniref:Tyrosinase copper-binding domain-containing protein n=1 Tax=Catenaria anguillulae PL171 TaxID=765915 RepID=A0A1Y2I367_9FUNG|nr:hypothetical protein BCR44DRAFT_1173706 [Catenaria anguillulae PL171]
MPALIGIPSRLHIATIARPNRYTLPHTPPTSIMRSISILVAIVLALLASTQSADAQCRVRKELRDLSGSEKRALVDGLVAMHRDGSLERLRKVHADNIPVAHNTNNFLLWHRAFMWDAEDELLRHTSGLSGMPYIDLTRDARDPASSPAFRNDLFMP